MKPGHAAPTLLGIVGSGLMGRGIARVASQGGIPVVLHHSRPGGAAACERLFVVAAILRILDRLFDFHRDPRYRPSPWLKRRAMPGVSLLIPKN